MRWRWAQSINTMEIDLKVGSLLVMGFLYFIIYICVLAGKMLLKVVVVVVCAIEIIILG